MAGGLLTMSYDLHLTSEAKLIHDSHGVASKVHPSRVFADANFFFQNA